MTDVRDESRNVRIDYQRAAAGRVRLDDWQRKSSISSHNCVLKRLEARLATNRLENGHDERWNRPVRVDLEVLRAASKREPTGQLGELSQTNE